MSFSTATVESSAAIQWSSGDNFDGYLIFKLVPPDGREFLVWEDSGLRVPSRFIFPIEDGVISTIPELPYNASFTPPNSQYRAFWYDKSLTSVASGVGFVTVAADPYTVTVPTLTAPSAESTPPTLSENPSETILTGMTQETISGTKNGTNTAFTISRNANQVIVILNTDVLAEGVGYTRSGVDITAVAPYIPQSGDSYRAILVH